MNFHNYRVKWFVKYAGVLSMLGGALWFIANVLEETFDLFPPAGEGPLYVGNQLLSLLALILIALGYFGIRWNQGVTTRFGKVSIWSFAIGNLLIVVGGFLALLLRSDDSAIFLVFPIGALLMDLGALFTGILVAKEVNWQGWTRYMPLIYAAYLWLGIEIPFILGAFPEGGPGPVPTELIQDVGLFLVGLAIYKNNHRQLSNNE